MKLIRLEIILVVLFFGSIFSQSVSPNIKADRYSITGRNAKNIVDHAEKLIARNDGSIAEIEFSSEFSETSEKFLSENLNDLGLSGQSELRKTKEYSDKLGMVHKRYKQFYKGYEIPVAEYIFHEKKGRLIRANGIIIPGLKISTEIRISENAALNIAVREVNAEQYMWETNEADAGQYYPKSKLVISSRKYSLNKEDLRLVYQFDIYAKKPVARYNVEVDAITGEVINIFNKIHTADVSGSGNSMYNGTVPMTIDSLSAASASSPPCSIREAYWHVGQVQNSLNTRLHSISYIVQLKSTQNPAGATPWGFDSPSRHHLL